MTRYQHVMQLAEKYQTKVYFHDNGLGALALVSPRANYRWYGSDTRQYKIFNVKTYPRGERAIIVPRPWRNKCAYFTCLHELGHIAMRHTPKRYRNDAMRCEIQAWNWAMRHSMVSPDANVLDDIRWALTHHPHAKRNDELIDRWMNRWSKHAQ